MSGGLLLDLINQVLDLSRIEAGKVDLKIEDVPIEELLNECVILITPTADEKSVTVNLDMDSGIVNSVRTDYVRLKEVILNLLSNAVKYNKPKGTVQISVNIQDRKFVRFSVADTGVGFRLDDHEKIFLPFNRLDTIKRKEEGTGIGLAITKNLVTLMNGKIGVESEVGVGSKFWVDIPAASR